MKYFCNYGQAGIFVSVFNFFLLRPSSDFGVKRKKTQETKILTFPDVISAANLFPFGRTFQRVPRSPKRKPFVIIMTPS